MCFNNNKLCNFSNEYTLTHFTDNAKYSKLIV